MKKRVLATILAVCLLFSVMACMASAANVTVGEIIVSKRICPGDVIDFDFIERPAIEGGVFSEGWEILSEDGVWIPYDGEPIGERAGTFEIRYFATDAAGNYAYSNTCVVTAKHNADGPYEGDGLDHWRICKDCGGQTDFGHHDHVSSSATAANKVCTVCGHVRTSQWTGLLGFWEWLISILAMFIG